MTTQLAPTTLVDAPPFDPRLVSLIAAGVADPFDIAVDFGLSASEFRKLQTTPAFVQALEHARKELEETGYSAEYAELLMLQESQPRMVKDLVSRFHLASTTFEQKLKLLELTDKMLASRRSRLSPKTTTNPTDSLPMIQIVLPGSGQAVTVSAGAIGVQHPHTIDVTVQDEG